MPKPLVKSIKEKRELTVYHGLKSGNWVHIFKAALQAFNQLGLRMKMTQASSKESANEVLAKVVVCGAREIRSQPEN